MSRRGTPYDNAKVESFRKTMKVEAVYPMVYETFEDVIENLPQSIIEISVPPLGRAHNSKHYFVITDGPKTSPNVVNPNDKLCSQGAWPY
jgi:transposase InsO family protein